MIMNKAQQQSFWMVLLGLEKPVIPKASVSYINRFKDEPTGRFTDTSLYPEFSGAIRSLYLQGIRNTKKIYEYLLEKDQVPVVVKNNPMAINRALEYINAVRKELGISQKKDSISKKIIQHLNEGITDTTEIMNRTGANKKYISDIKSKYIKSKGKDNG